MDPNVIVSVVGQINPLLMAATAVIGAIRSVFAAARAANVTVFVDPATLKVYATQEAAVADGVDPATLVSELPDDSVLIAKLLSEAGLLKKEASDAREWLRDSGLLAD